MSLPTRVLVACAFVSTCFAQTKPLPYTGVNLGSGSFGAPTKGKPLVYGRQYVYSNDNEIGYFASKGMNVFRIAFHWENLQPTLNGAFEREELSRLKSLVRSATSRGLVAILDPHNYARYYGGIVGSEEVPEAAFASFWGKLAAEFATDDRVWFGLMNEPHDMPTLQWLRAANAAIAAIRRSGAKNLILVPGNDWSGAHSWVGSENATTMLGVKDPLEHYAYEVHQYLDSDSSGTHWSVVSPTIGAERLKQFVRWCREHKKRAFLGEFGVGADVDSRTALEEMLRAIERDRDVWLGFTWWAAGPWWGDYPFSLEPKEMEDRPQMSFLRPHLQRTAVVTLPSG